MNRILFVVARSLIMGWLVVAAGVSVQAQEPVATAPNPALQGYANYDQVTHRVQTLEPSPWASTRSLGKTVGGREIWLVTLSSPDAPPVTSPLADERLQLSYQDRPAILIVGNVHAPHVVGCEIALGIAEDLATRAAAGDEAVTRFLKRYTVYVIPSPTPDATEKNFSSAPRREHTGNNRPTDDDRDFKTGEDPPQDLNGDGWITMMRVHDELGTHKAHDRDPRILVPIDPKKNERAAYRLYVESRDLDQDKAFGEDASDGVNFNRNLTFNYKFFSRGAGPHQVSEPETRAVVDFAFDHPNIALVLSFSPEDNLFKPWKANPQAERERIKTTILAADAPFADFLAERFRNLHGGKDPPNSPKGEGSFAEWAYYHYGRWSFASRGWWIPKTAPPAEPKTGDESQMNPKQDDSSGSQFPGHGPSVGQPAEQDPQPGGRRGAAGGGGGGRRGGPPTGGDATSGSATADPATPGDPAAEAAQDLNALNWFASQQIDGFVPWTKVEHPDFPGQTVEVGGFLPFYRMNPPANLLPEIVKPHVSWLLEVGELWPTIEIREPKVESLGASLYRVTCKVTNTGYLPTMPEMARVNREGYPLQVALLGPTGVKLEFIEGSARRSIGRLDGRGGNSEQVWIVRAPDNTPVSGRLVVFGPTITSVETVIELK